MRVIALIEDPAVIRRILEHLGEWAEDVPDTQGSPPVGIDWPANATLPLTYIAVPDIA